MRHSIVLAVTAVAAFIAQPVMAHHSSAMFDTAQNISLTGTVKEFEWSNPHSWIRIMTDENGAVVQHDIECQSPNILVRRGWRPSSIKTGDKITVVFHPLKDGTAGGQVVSVTIPDGTTLTTTY